MSKYEQDFYRQQDLQQYEQERQERRGGIVMDAYEQAAGTDLEFPWLVDGQLNEDGALDYLLSTGQAYYDEATNSYIIL